MAGEVIATVSVLDVVLAMFKAGAIIAMLIWAMVTFAMERGREGE